MPLLAGTNTSGFPVFFDGSRMSGYPSWLLSIVRLSYPGKSSNDCEISLESGRIRLYNTLISEEECLYAENITLSEDACCDSLTSF